jgi:DNA-binding MarR family transcriptional regulator
LNASKVKAFSALPRTRNISRRADWKTVLVAITKLGIEKLDAARPIHAASVRRNLLSRLTQEQIDTIVRVSNLLGEED